MVSPDDEEPNRVEFSEAPLEPPESPPEPATAAPVKRKRSAFSRALLWTLLLLVFASAALYAAIVFKDSDERLKVVADYVEPYVGQASGVFGAMKDRVGSLFNRTEPAQTTTPEAPPAAAPNKSAETPAEPSRQESSRAAEQAAQSAMHAAIESQNAAVAALQSRVASAEDAAQRALRAAEAAEAAANSIKATAEAAADSAKAAVEAAAKAGPATAAPSETGERSGLTAGDQVTALEGRIDELGEELKKLRERLESPKSETRAAPETAAAKVADGPAALVVVAYALQRELEAGRPYAVEAKALTRLGADPAALAALSPLAEKGAPTAAQLKADFAIAAKRIRALEGGDSGDLAQHLMKGASKLVRVRPSGAPTSEAQTVDERVAQIDAALANGDLAQAAALFAALPEAAQNEAKDFGAALRARIEAGRAAEDLLHGAIAALGARKE